MVLMTNETKAGLGLIKGKKGKKFHEINESEDNGMDDLADQVQSLFYHDVHFNNVNMRMHTELGCEMSQNRSKKVFKVDTGADGNLMPITMFMKLCPKISLETLAKTIDKGITPLHTITLPLSSMVHAVFRLPSKENKRFANFMW